MKLKLDQFHFFIAIAALVVVSSFVLVEKHQSTQNTSVHIEKQDSQEQIIEAENISGNTGNDSLDNAVFVSEALSSNELSEADIVDAETIKTSEPDVWLMSDDEKQKVQTLCHEIGTKLGSVSVEDCLQYNLAYAGAMSINKRPLAIKDFHPDSGEEAHRILILGGIHGDEYASISIMFKWMKLLNNQPSDYIHWRFIPSANPDGLLDGEAIRQNASGVDLNRNFPSQDWHELAQNYWVQKTGSNPRRYPGEQPASEPEVKWLVTQIAKFQPDVIVSVHAPYHLLDFDGPAEPPGKIGELYLHELGVYPGSLGNYAGVDLGIPVVTLELPYSGIMPTDEQIQTMWDDLHAWLDSRIYQSGQLQAAR